MRAFCHSLDRLDVTFDDEHLVANAGLMLPATLAKHLGLREFFDEHVDLGDGAGRGQCRPQGDDPRPLGGVGPAGTQVAATVAASRGVGRWRRHRDGHGDAPRRVMCSCT